MDSVSKVLTFHQIDKVNLRQTLNKSFLNGDSNISSIGTQQPKKRYPEKVRLLLKNLSDPRDRRRESSVTWKMEKGSRGEFGPNEERETPTVVVKLRWCR